MREGVPSLEMAEEMAGLGRDLLPLASPIMDFIHQRYLSYFSEQDVIGHMEQEVDGDPNHGRVRVAIAFADLAGYTRYVEEEGEEEALSYVERFIDAVGDTLPEGARLVKTIGDEVMVVGQDVQAILDWGVGFSRLYADERPAPRIGINAGPVIYRDGDYFGREVNLASRVVARARGGEVLVTGAVLDEVREKAHLRVDSIGQVKLKGFSEPRALCRVATAD
jgi:adenylate cyclase